MCLCVGLKKKNAVHMISELYYWNNISKNTFLRRGLLYRNLLSVLFFFFKITVSPKCFVVLLIFNSFYYAYFATYYRTYSTDFRNRGTTVCQTQLTRHIYKQYPILISLCELRNTAQVLET